MEFIVYAIKSVKDGILYSGFTENIERRLKEHNSGKSKFTSGHMSWEVVYTEIVGDRITARKREKYLKSAAGRRFISKKMSL